MPRIIVTVETPSRLDNNNAEEFGGEVLALIEAGTFNLILDCDLLVYLSSAGIRSFLRIAQASKRVNARLIFACCHPEVMRIIRLCGLEEMGTFTETLEGAKARLR